MAKPWLTLQGRMAQLQTSWGDHRWIDADGDGVRDAGEALLRGKETTWNADTVTYMIADSPADDVDPPGGRGAFRPEFMTPEAAETARLAFELWDDLIRINLTEGTATPHSGITVAYYNNPETTRNTFTDGITDYSREFSPNEFAITARPIYIERERAEPPPDGDFVFGGQPLWTFLHEAGHSLGLSHPSPYNQAHDDGTPRTYAVDAAYAQDTKQYSVMSYFGKWVQDPADGIWGFDVNAGQDDPGLFPQTPMLDDVAAIQDKYGVDTATRLGATTYGFNSTADKDVFDFRLNPRPILTIWDSGGVDTLDCSGFSRTVDGRVEHPNQTIDLRQGTFSNVGFLEGNLAIAYNCDIENAIGARGNDTIYGNSLSNRVEGRGGNDILYGYGGRDFLFGGDGGDTLIGGLGSDDMRGGAGNDVFQFLTVADSPSWAPSLIPTGGKFGSPLVAPERAWDAILDFQRGDVIDLSMVDANSTLAGRQSFTLVAGFTGHAGELEAHRTAPGGPYMINGDVNGDGRADFTLEVTMEPGAALTDANFYLRPAFILPGDWIF